METTGKEGQDGQSKGFFTIYTEAQQVGLQREVDLLRSHRGRWVSKPQASGSDGDHKTRNKVSLFREIFLA